MKMVSELAIKKLNHPFTYRAFADDLGIICLESELHDMLEII